MNSNSCLLGVDFHGQSLKLFVKGLLDLKFRGKSIHLASIETLVSSAENSKLRIVLNSGLVIADSTPIRFLIRRKNPYFVGFRGADLLREVISSDTSLTHFFIVSNDQVSSKFVQKVSEINPQFQLVGIFAPPLLPLDFDPGPWINELRLSGVDIVWVGLGSPKQDLIASKLASALKSNVVAIGAAINFIAGDLKECPQWLQNSGLEWLFRLLVEPRRLWRRYLLGSIKFLKYLLRQNSSRNHFLRGSR